MRVTILHDAFGRSTGLKKDWGFSALVEKGIRLGELGRSEEAIAVYNDLIARFGTATELPLREPLANALFNKAKALDELGRSEEAIAVCDDLIARFGTATEPTLTAVLEAAGLDEPTVFRLESVLMSRQVTLGDAIARIAFGFGLTLATHAGRGYAAWLAAAWRWCG